MLIYGGAFAPSSAELRPKCEKEAHEFSPGEVELQLLLQRLAQVLGGDRLLLGFGI